MQTGNHSPAPLTTEERFTLEPGSSHQLAALCGQFNENLQMIERRLGVKIAQRGHDFAISGHSEDARIASRLVHELYREAESGPVASDLVHLFLQQSHREQAEDTQEGARTDTEAAIAAVGQADTLGDWRSLRTKRMLVKPRGANQQNYVRAIHESDINFGVGPAGTGKTWLAVACAVSALERDRVQRIVLVRPAVEAGEKLGFLPGDLNQKIDPYLRPLYDALYEMLGYELVGKLIERNVIEIAPLAYMRGRTLNDSFIILDESQNTTKAQMKMFLTRIGFGSTAVITGDLTQIDLPSGTHSGLKHVVKVLKNISGISFTHFEPKDVVRHALVQRIVEAYEEYESSELDDSQRAN